MNPIVISRVAVFPLCLLLNATASAVDTDSALQEPGNAYQVPQVCSPGHHFLGRAGASLGFNSNTRPPTETIGSGAGGGGGGAGGPHPQPLIDETQQDTFVKANASLTHGNCLTSDKDSLAIVWISRFGLSDNRYLSLAGADEQSLNITTGPEIASNWFWRVTPGLDFEAANLEGKPYLKRIAVSSNQVWNLSYNWQASFRLSAGRVEFDQVPTTIHAEGHDKSVFVASTILLSPFYRMKISASHISQSTDDVQLNFNSNTFQFKVSRWHPLNCEVYLSYRIKNSDYESLAISGAKRTDEISGIELGGCATVNPDWLATASLQHNISDSNVVEFIYRGSILELSLQYRF